MPKKKNKKKLKKSISFLLFVVITLLVVTIFYYAFDHSIRNIYIYNNNYLTDQEIIEYAKLDNYPNIFKKSSSSLEKILKENPYIKDVKIKKDLLYGIHIKVEENKILFVRMDTKKIVFENKEEIDYNKEILNIPYLINYVPNTKYDKLIEKLSEIDNTIINKISEIKYDPNEYDEDRFLLYMNDDNKVYVTLTKLDLLNKYNESITKFEGKKGTLYLDSGNYFEIGK